MDPRSSAQDVHRCDLCETAIVHSYCDVCHVNLCKPCVVDHISDGYQKHAIVPFMERRSTLVYPKCETHPHKNCELQCEDCNNICVCSSCTASKQHKGHNFVEVTEVYKTKKEVIKKDIKELENHISPSYEIITLELEQTLANLDVGYEKLTTTMSKQGEEWHREIDIVINKMKTKISEIKVQHREILQKHLNQIKQIQSVIKQSLLAIREIENSTEVSSTIEYSSRISEFSKIPPKVQVSLPTFIPKSIDREKLYSLFGQITPLSTATEDNISLLNQPNTTVRELLDELELVTTIQTGLGRLSSVTCLNEDKIWTSGITSDIKCFNIKGSLLHTIQTKSGRFPYGITVDSDGYLLYSDCSTGTVYKVKNGQTECFNNKGLLLQKIKTKSGNFPHDIAVGSDEYLLYSDGSRCTGAVHKVKNGQTEELIRLQGWTPGNLCVTSTGDLLVTMYSDDTTQSKVVCYTGSSEKQTIQFDDEGKHLYSGNGYTKLITENRNHDICVADWAAGAVVVANQDGKLRWRYTDHPSVTKKKPFKPRGIATDSQSHILTADFNNHCIHILDQNGQFLRYIDNCDLKNPYDICVDNNDNLFVCEYYKGNVEKTKYLK